MRKKADLIAECDKYNLVYNSAMTSDELMDVLMAYHCKGRDLLPQIEVMKAKDAAGKYACNFDFTRPDFWRSPYMDKLWNDERWIMDVKENGVRYKMWFTEKGIRVDSSRRSDSDYSFTEKTANFKHFKDYIHPAFTGTILDCEFRHKLAKIDTGKVVTASTLASAVAICNSGPELSQELQEKYGPIDAYVFDILYFRGEDIRDKDFGYRRGMLESVVTRIGHPNIFVTKICFAKTLAEKEAFYLHTIQSGGEGVMFKHIYGRYESGKRVQSILKLKKFIDVDAFISGYIPGENDNTGKVGSICVSMMTRSGEAVEVGAFSNITDAERNEYTATDGSLKREFYDRVVALRSFEVTKNNRLAHARRYEWRPDKSPNHCIFEEQILGE